MKKIRPIKSTWYDWLINYVPEPMRKSVGGYKYKVISLFKTNILRQEILRHFLNNKKKTPKKVSNYYNNNYIEYESNGHRNRNITRQIS